MKHDPKLVQCGPPAQSGGGGWGCLVVEVRGVGGLDLRWKTSYIPAQLSSRARPRGWAVEGMPGLRLSLTLLLQRHEKHGTGLRRRCPWLEVGLAP